MLMEQSSITEIKNFIKSVVHHARYLSNGIWYNTDIHSIETLSDGRIAIYLLFDHNAPDQIQRIEFYNVNGSLWASGDEDINKESFEEGILYRYTILTLQSAT